MKELGGYFGLELNSGGEYHLDAYKLNSGTNCLEHIITSNQIDRIFIPYFICPEIVHRLNKINVKVYFYSIDKKLEIINFKKILKKNIPILYVNYFGIKNYYISYLNDLFDKLIIDNAQSFFSKYLGNLATFYSPRKFFGVPDGGYLYGTHSENEDYPQDNSKNRFQHLTTNIEDGSESGYESFTINESKIKKSKIMRMSKLTTKLLSGIDYTSVKKKRRRNYLFAHENLRNVNKLDCDIDELDIPNYYPLMIKQKGLRTMLINRKIYIPIFWTGMNHFAISGSFETKLVNDLLPIPIDQRLTIGDMKHIINNVKDLLNDIEKTNKN